MKRWALALPGVGFLLILVFILLFYKGRNISSVNDNMSMRITSPSFQENASVPVKYTCDGEAVSPPLRIGGVPAEALSVALIMDDPDAPGGTFIHWLLWNIDPKTTEIPEASTPGGAVVGANSEGKAEYFPPCPPSGTHHYRFTLYALRAPVNLKQGESAQDLQVEMDSSNIIIEQSQLTGLYQRQK